MLFASGDRGFSAIFGGSAASWNGASLQIGGRRDPIGLTGDPAGFAVAKKVCNDILQEGIISGKQS